MLQEVLEVDMLAYFEILIFWFLAYLGPVSMGHGHS